MNGRRNTADTPIPAPDDPLHPPPQLGEHHGPKLVAAAFGMDPRATLIYLADHVDEG
ncbi:hypothetical protein [Streptomyces sudanensis]|uniref:hypothetical protein n=1 Tax=Streptomyces sudanensis TaxID=436397 RepID=UPI0020CD0263|nr:hypothetical protein [Streptomyces sudanensis]MCQ0002831.1 hypothetical protein [Streptomyces sudanensis]